MIESIDEEDFGPCCEIVYSGDYSPPCPVPQSPGNGTPQPEIGKRNARKRRTDGILLA